MINNPMNLYAEEGTKVRFTGLGGYEYDKKHALMYMEVDQILTVKYIEVFDSSSSVFFDEIKFHGFNTVMFAAVE